MAPAVRRRRPPSWEAASTSGLSTPRKLRWRHGRERRGEQVHAREMKEGGEGREGGGKGGREGGTHRKKASKSAVSVGCFLVVPARAITMSLRYSFMVSIIIYWRGREGGREGRRGEGMVKRDDFSY